MQDRFEDYRAVCSLSAVDIERAWQDAKWGITDHGNETWLALLAEEFGEAAQDVNVARTEPDRKEAALDNLEVELIQVAATAVAWVDCLGRKRK